MIEILSKSPLFGGIDADKLVGLLEEFPYQLKEFNKGSMIVQSGEECKNLFIVLKGSVSGEMMDFSGKTIKIEDIFPPRPLAVAFLFGQKNRYPVNIIANENTQLLSIPKSSVLGMMQKSEVFLTNFLNSISGRAQFLSEKIRLLSFHTIKGKLAAYFLQIKPDEQGMVHFSQSQQKLAELFGVARPSLARALGEMAKDGIIHLEGKNLQILDKGALSALLK